MLERRSVKERSRKPASIPATKGPFAELANIREARLRAVKDCQLLLKVDGRHAFSLEKSLSNFEDLTNIPKNE